MDHLILAVCTLSAATGGIFIYKNWPTLVIVYKLKKTLNLNWFKTCKMVYIFLFPEKYIPEKKLVEE